MKKFIFPLTVFIFTCALSASVAWCGGYDFDHRSRDVGLWVGGTLYLAFLSSGATLALLIVNKKYL